MSKFHWSTIKIFVLSVLAGGSIVYVISLNLNHEDAKVSVPFDRLSEGAPASPTIVAPIVPAPEVKPKSVHPIWGGSSESTQLIEPPTPVGTPISEFIEPKVKEQEKLESKSSEESILPPSIAALREVAEEASKPGLAGGLGMRVPKRELSQRQGGEITPTPTPSEPSFDPVGGQPRGYAMLYLMHPKARITVEKQVETIIRANISDIYLGVLTDGTFGLDFPYLENVLTRLSEEGRSVTLVTYLSNGASQRDFESTPIGAGFVRIDPLEFRSLIKFDPQIRFRYRTMVERVSGVMQHNLSLGPRNRNIAVVMLEDNLDRDSYKAMRDIAQSVLGDLCDYMRNPCPGCFDGNDTDALGDGVELHKPSDINALGPNDGFTLDGFGYRFNEPAGLNRLSTSEVINFTVLAKQRNLRFFGLWRAQRQGLVGGKIAPDLREYEVPTEDQIQEEIQMLRAGL